jgi:hypothetical protein
MKRNVFLVSVMTGLLVTMANLSVAYAVETITVRSGQALGVPGAVGAYDDIVTFNPGGNPPGAPLSPVLFPYGFFIATATSLNRAIVVMQHPAWMFNQIAPLSDPLARWIDFECLVVGFCLGAPGSALYAVPFSVNSTTITSATLRLEGGVDDVLGDWFSMDGPNLDGLYINGTGLGYMYQGFNFAFPTTHFQDITVLIGPGQNYLFFYQRDFGFAVSGLIFSATITVNGCVRTQGYWKSHSSIWPPVGPGPTPSLTLGTVNYSPAQLLAILGQPVQGNGLISLAHQLITAKLNQANGAPVPPAVQTAINAADALIGGLVVPPTGNGYLKPNQTSSLINTLDAYNNGQLSGGPPHCGD